MTLLNASELGVSPESLRTAEALVAAALGATSLEARPVAQAGMVTSGVIPLRDGPLTAVLTFTVNGYPATPLTHPWHIEVAPITAPYGLASYGYGYGAYALTYTAGWTAENVPEAVREAIRQAAQAVEAAGAEDARVIAERVGDVETRYAAPVTAGLDGAAAMLLGPYRRLRF